MLWYFTCTRNRVPSAHMHSLYLSRPSSKYTSPTELGMRVALNMTDPLRTILFSCKENKQNASILTYFSDFVPNWETMHTSIPASWVILTVWVETFHTYSLELDASTHFELHSPAHDVDALVSTNDGLAIPFNVQVRCSTTGDLKSVTMHNICQRSSQHIQGSTEYLYSAIFSTMF